MHDVELVMVGYELLRGDRRDLHLEYLGRRLLDVGVRIDRVHVVGDERGEIADVVRDRLSLTRVLVVTGGLGPTHDDVTREGVADGLDLPLDFDDDQWAYIQAYFESYGRRASESNRRQAMFPRGAVPVTNTRGTAPGFTIEREGCFVAVLPGPPTEFRAMADAVVLPAAAKIFARPPALVRTFRTMGIGESAMAELFDSLRQEYTEFSIASLPHVAGVDIILRANPDAGLPATLAARAGEFEGSLRRELGNKIYATGELSLEEVVGLNLVERGSTIALAESLTGGLLGKRLTDVPGSSRYVLEDVVAYSNASKMELLGVSEASLAAFGAVSEPVCREMAEGIRKRAGATYGVATTGVAGPAGGSREKPVGLAYCGISWEGGSDVRHRVFPGNRTDIRERVVWTTLFLLYERLS